MKNLSIEAKEIINDLFEKGYTPREIKNAMEDGAFLESARISQEIAEEIHNFLSKPNIFEAEIAFSVEKSIANEKDQSIIYGKIIKILPIK